MFLNAVILVLQEILEAALLISMLLLVTRLLNAAADKMVISMTWLPMALMAGVLSASLYAWYIPVISEWFDYVGLEVTNAGCQLLAIVLLLVFMYRTGNRTGADGVAASYPLAGFCLAVVVALAIMREGSEIVLYMMGIMGQPEAVSPVVLGGLLAAGIGVSCGILLYYALAAASFSVALRIALALLALFTGNMASQAVLLLTQADWLPFTEELWDSSTWLPEYSITGQLLYALVGYEATPSLLQAMAYLLAVVLVVTSPLFRRIWWKREPI